jgi:hypothetical protein
MAKRTRRTRKPREKTNEAHSRQIEQHIAKKGPVPGDPAAPTPERMAAAKRAQERITPILERTHTGNPTGRVTWRVEPVIIRMLHNKALKEADYAGIEEFWSWCEAYSRYANAKGMSYESDRVQKSGRSESPQERAREAQGVLLRATRSMDRRFRPMVVYLSGQISEDQSLARFMWEWYPHTRHMGDRAARQEGQSFIRHAAASLACFFGFSDDSFAEIREHQRKVAAEIMDIEAHRRIENWKKSA